MYEKIPMKSITKIALVQTNGKKTVAQVKAEQKCRYVLNCTLYDFKTFVPLCPCRINGKTLTTSKDGYWCYAFNSGPDFQMIHSKNMNQYQNVFSCSTMLKDGQNTIFTYTKEQGGIRGRSAVGIDKDNNLVLFCSKDGTKDAYSPEKLRDFMKNTLGCVSAIMLDSGGSSSCDFNGKKITTTRKVANYLCIWTSDVSEKETPKTSSQCPYSVPSVTVRRGMRGDSVRWVQWQLWQRGYFQTEKDVDGVFGGDTYEALCKFQRSVKLKDDGACGLLTRSALKV